MYIKGLISCRSAAYVHHGSLMGSMVIINFAGTYPVG